MTFRLKTTQPILLFESVESLRLLVNIWVVMGYGQILSKLGLAFYCLKACSMLKKDIP